MNVFYFNLSDLDYENFYQIFTECLEKYMLMYRLPFKILARHLFFLDVFVVFGDYFFAIFIKFCIQIFIEMDYSLENFESSFRDFGVSFDPSLHAICNYFSTIYA